jgi:hypothetical protein
MGGDYVLQQPLVLKGEISETCKYLANVELKYVI